MPLYVIGTPIGNLSDLSDRAKDIIRRAKIFMCEQREFGRKLLNHIGANPDKFFVVSTKEFLPRRILDELEVHDGVLTVSSGTPGISDPGSKIVNLCLENGIKVIPIPGPSAVIAALSVCGLNTSRFIFLGFIPKKGRKGFLEKVKRGLTLLPFSPLLVIYESPHRVIATLKDIREVFGEKTKVFLAREMTKVFEEFIRGTVIEVLENLYERTKENKRIKGEITLVIDSSNIYET